MKKKLLLLLLLLGLMFPTLAHAQLMETDKDITVTFHIDPNDHPLPGKPATLYFQFYDISNKFDLAKCNCVVTVTEHGQQVFSQAVTHNEKKGSDWDTHIPYTFQQKADYQVAVVGEPMVVNAFQPFKTSWGVTVEPGQLPQKPVDHTPLYFMIGIIGIPTVAILLCLLATRL